MNNVYLRLNPRTKYMKLFKNCTLLWVSKQSIKDCLKDKEHPGQKE